MEVRAAGQLLQRSLPLTGREAALFEHSIPQRFSQMVRRDPQALAVGCEERAMCYGELELASSRLAGALVKRLGAGRQVIATALPLDVTAIVAMLGVLRAGKLLMPLAHGRTDESTRAALDDAEAQLVIADASLAAGLADHYGTPTVEYDELLAGSCEAGERLDPGDDALLLYTSGSQGRPKGVAISHRAELHSTLPLAEAIGLGPGASFWQLYSLTFSAAILWSLAPLMSGAELWLHDLSRSGLGQLPQRLARGRAAVMALVPSVLREFVAVAAPDDLRTIRRVVVGGERLVASDLERAWRVFPHSCAFLQVLGSAEAVMVGWSLFQRPPEEGDLPLHAFPDTRLEIVDDSGHPAPVGEVGELMVCSRYMSRGYWNRPELTNAAFRAQPNGTQSFRTGDYGWLDEDHRLHFVGRRDRQVKVRGQRLELGAVETAILGLDVVKSAAVTGVEGDGGTSLAAYVVPARAEPRLQPAEIRRALVQMLPAAAVPSLITVVDKLPTLDSGKLDRQAIRAIALRRGAAEALAERDDLEGVRDSLRRIWKELLERPVEDADDFFLIGGDSLLAMRMLVEIEEQFSCALTPGALLEASTVERLARVICRSGPHVLPRSDGHTPDVRSGGPPLFIAYPQGGHGLRYRPLADALGGECLLHVLESPWWDGRPTTVRTVEQLAAHHVTEIRDIQPSGPYLVGGYSSGGLIALEIARQLVAAGHQIALLVMIDTYAGVHPSEASNPRNWVIQRSVSKFGRVRDRVWLWLLTALWWAAQMVKHLLVPARRLRWRCDHRFLGAVPERRRAPYVHQLVRTALTRYRPLPYDGRIVLFRCTADRWPAADRGWGPLALGVLEIHDLEAGHFDVLRPPAVNELAAQLAPIIRTATRRHGQPGSRLPSANSPTAGSS
jgi:acyl-coenzyme A synthetase/AMP-(fatty) acid ligase/thioesterase domain-containing protein/acyl carrier protein